jgi:hygromycin-B 4-O-kinase
VGSWGADGHAPYASWASHLLSVCEDTPDQRIYGWRRKLETESPLGWETFQWGLARLQEVADVAVPRALLHCDLLNRNVLVEQGKLTAVFDWGCGRYGDPLYDLAWFEFWAPWHPNLDIPLLRSALEQRWQEAGCTPANQQTRLDACYLHIGLDHLAYNAYLGRWETLEATAAQMRALIERNAGCL